MMEAQNNQNILPADAMQEEIDLENPQKRCICALLIDSSASVAADQTALEAAFPAFMEATRAHDLSEQIELGVWTFARTPQVIHPIREIYRYAQPFELTLQAKGRTHTGEAVLTVLEAMDARAAALQDMLGIHPYTPVLLILTDGNPNYTDEPLGREKAEAAWETACAELAKRVRSRRLQVVVIGVGNHLRTETLQLLAGGAAGKPFIRLEAVEDWSRLFAFVTQTFVTATQGGSIRTSFDFAD